MTKKNTKHFLGDLIQFDDVEDEDFFDEDIELVDDKISTCTSLSSRKQGKQSENNNDNPNEEDNYDDYEDLANNFDTNSNSSESSSSNNLIDDETKNDAFRHIIAGACMSIGLKFAGTFNNDAYQTLVILFKKGIKWEIKAIILLFILKLFWANYFTDLNDSKLTTENCLCVIVLSLAIVSYFIYFLNLQDYLKKYQ